MYSYKDIEKILSCIDSEVIDDVLSAVHTFCVCTNADNGSCIIKCTDCDDFQLILLDEEYE